MRELVEATIKDKILPMLQADGGGIDLVNVTDEGVVEVRLTGACGGCPMSAMTLKNGVEVILKKEVSGVTKVVAV